MRLCVSMHPRVYAHVELMHVSARDCAISS
jgi:hypothetical protein